MSKYQWKTIDGDTFVEVMPIDDERQHWSGDECWCQPDVERKDDSRPLISHNLSPRLYEHTTPYDAHLHFDAHKALQRRLDFIKTQVKNQTGKPRLNYTKAEIQSIKYALKCLEFTKVNSRKSHTKGNDLELKDD